MIAGLPPPFFIIAGSMFGAAAFCAVMVNVRLRHNRQRLEQLRAQQQEIANVQHQTYLIQQHMASMAAQFGTPLTAELRQSAGVLARQRLKASLSEEQWRTLEHHGWFKVTAKSGCVYRLTTADGPVGNITCVTTGDRWCMHLVDHTYGTGAYPIEDHLLAQALLIRTDETAFRSIAHRMR